MATFLPPVSVSRMLTRANYFHLSSQSQPNPQSNSSFTPVSSGATPSKPLTISSSELQPPLPLTAGKEQQEDINPIRSKPATKADSTDWIASGLTRRFGLGAGLAWAGFLAFGVVSEQVKTRLEIATQQSGTRNSIDFPLNDGNVESQEEVILPNGIRYYELVVGGGASPRAGDLTVIDLKGMVQGSGEVFVDTFSDKKKSLALVMGSRPYSKGMCEGIEFVLQSMKAGGKRRVIVPPNFGFGEKGADLGSDIQIPPFSTLEFVVQVDKVSIAPS